MKKIGDQSWTPKETLIFYTAMSIIIAGFIVAISFLLYTMTKPGPSSAMAESDRNPYEISYSKDERTGLCFAAVASRTYSRYKVISIANVPCQNVSHLIK